MSNRHSKASWTIANVAHYALNVWVGEKRRYASNLLSKQCCTIPMIQNYDAVLTRYRAQQIREVMYIMGLIHKAENGRYYFVNVPDIVNDIVDAYTIGQIPF